MSGNVTCPACGSPDIDIAEDIIRNLHVLVCCGCGELYAFADDDLHDFGFGQIVREWHESYARMKRLEVRDG